MPGAWVANLGTATSAGVASTTLVVTLTTNVKVGDTVILGCSADGASSPTVTGVTDSRGNTYTVDKQLLQGTAVMNAVASAPVTTALLTNDTITITYSASVLGRAAVAQSFTGLLGVSVAASNGTGNAASGTTATATGAGSEPLADTVSVVSASIGAAASAFTVGAGFSNFQSVDTTSTVRHVAFESKVNTASGVQSGTVTWTTSAAWASCITVYEAIPVVVAAAALFRRQLGIPALSRFISSERWIGGLDVGLSIGGVVAAADVTLLPSVAAASGAQSSPVLKADYLPAVGAATGAETAPTLLATYLPVVNSATGSAPVPTLQATYLPATGAATGAQTAPTLLTAYLPSMNAATALAPTPVLSAAIFPAVGAATGAQAAPTLLATYLPSVGVATAAADAPVVDNQFVLVDPPLLFRSGFGTVGLSRFITTEQGIGGREPNLIIGGSVVGGDVTISPAVNAATAAGAIPTLITALLASVNAATGVAQTPLLSASYVTPAAAATGAGLVPSMRLVYLPGAAQASGAGAQPVLAVTFPLQVAGATGSALVPVLNATFLIPLDTATAVALIPVITGTGFAVAPDTIRTHAVGLIGLTEAAGVTGRGRGSGVTGITSGSLVGSRTHVTGGDGSTDV